MEARGLVRAATPADLCIDVVTSVPEENVWMSPDEDDPTDEIARIEARLEQLAEVAERCRKFILASTAAIAAGGALLLVVVLGLFGADQTVAIGSIAAVLGGIVSLGSNVSTLRQTMAAISEAEAHRSDLIGMIDLQMVGDRTLKLT